MKVIDKLKSIAVKINPPRRSREEFVYMSNLDADGKYNGPSLRGMGRSLKEAADGRRKYAKNYARIQGLCKGCEHFDSESKTVGGHCRLKAEENCAR